MGRRLTWRTVAASVAGAGHRARGVECQDASVVEVVGGALVLAVADGAGSVPRAAEGAARAVEAALAYMRAQVPDSGPLPPPGLEVLAAARAALEPAPDEADVTLADRATTLLVVALTDGVVASAQVGDGAVVVRRDGVLEVLAPAERGEYLNETCFLTSLGWQAEARVATLPGDGVDAVAVLTDGLQLVAFDLASGCPHLPFFAPLFAFAAGAGPPEELAGFLASDRVAERTDDDVTLALAVLGDTTTGG